MDRAVDPSTAVDEPPAPPEPTAVAPQPRPLAPEGLTALVGQVALVSGASAGIGRAVSLALGRAGADVV